MERRRFAMQRMLAEGPRYYPGLEELQELDAISRAVEKNTGELRERIGVGPVLAKDGDKYQLQLSLSGFGEGLPHVGTQGVLMKQGVEQLLNSRPQRLASVAFGWGRPGGDYIASFNQEPGLMKQAMGVNYAQELRQALPELMGRMGLAEGDLVYNHPLRDSRTDLRRPLAYMSKANFGPLDLSGSQYGAVNSSGMIDPMLIRPAHADMMRRLGWQEGSLLNEPPQRSGNRFDENGVDNYGNDYDPAEGFEWSWTPEMDEKQELQNTLNNMRRLGEMQLPLDNTYATPLQAVSRVSGFSQSPVGTEGQEQLMAVAQVLDRARTEDPKAAQALMAALQHQDIPHVLDRSEVNDAIKAGMADPSSAIARYRAIREVFDDIPF